MLCSLPPDLERHETLEASTNLPGAYHHEMYGIKDIHDTGITGKHIKIGVIDTGYREHYLLPHVVDAKSFVPRETVDDTDGHGTHVASIIQSIAPDATLYIAKGLGRQGGRSDWILDCIRWLHRECKVDMINGSYGSNGAYPPAQHAINEFEGDGGLFVAAAGNAGNRGRKNTIGYPARWMSALCIGAHNDRGEVTSFSSAGREMDLIAPGNRIPGASNQGPRKITFMSGTSQATPCVAGGLALVKQAKLESGHGLARRADSVRDQIVEWCGDGQPDDHNRREGHGVPRLGELLNSLKV